MDNAAVDTCIMDNAMVHTCIMVSTLYRLQPFVYAFQCLTGKFDNKIMDNAVVHTCIMDNTVLVDCCCYYHIYQFGTGRRTQKANKACKDVYL